MKLILAFAAAAVTVSTFHSAASAAPCAVGTTSHGQHAAADKTSKVDGGADGKVTPGAKAESPGTVGAMSNVGSNTQRAEGEKKPAEGKVVKPGDDC